MNEPIRVASNPIRTTVYIDGTKHRQLMAHLRGLGISYSKWVQMMMDKQLYSIATNQVETYERGNTDGNTN